MGLVEIKVTNSVIYVVALALFILPLMSGKPSLRIGHTKLEIFTYFLFRVRLCDTLSQSRRHFDYHCYFLLQK